jgi:small conductance mechanosensitive channel
MGQQTTDAVRHLTELLLASSLDVAGALAILAIGWVVASWAHRWTRRALDRARGMDTTLKPFLAAIVRYAILVFVVIAVLAQFGVQTASIIAALGTVGLAIGLALQGTLSHIAAGIMLLLLRPFRVGEYVDAEGIAGSVIEIDLFATELRTFDGVYLHVPNGTLLNRAIKNFSRNPTRRIDVKVGVSYGDDLDKALAVAKSMLESDPRILPDPAPETAVIALGDSSVDLNLRCWVKAADYWNVLVDLNKTIKQRLDAEGIAIPFPQHDVRIVENKSG